jgi:DNA-binding beta-propeller fold protein YncE
MQEKLLCTLFSTVALITVGCTPTPMVMNYGTMNTISQKVWPNPPDAAKYKYVGELTGEDNFQPDGAVNRTTARKVFDWLVGLTSRTETPSIVLQRPQSVITDGMGRTYVTDINKGAIYVFDKSSGKLLVWETAALGLHFKSPIGIALDDTGGILVADADLQGVFHLDHDGNPIEKFGENILKRPTGIARDSKTGITYISDTYSHDIKVFDIQNKLLRTIGRRGEDAGEFNFPTYLAYADSKLYVTDTLNSRIQVFDTSGKLLSKFGNRGLFVGNLVRPKGIAVDRLGNIYVIESLYDRLLIFNNEGKLLLAIGDSGKELGQFYLPAGVWVDDQNLVHIADMFNGRIVVLQFIGGPQ